MKISLKSQNNSNLLGSNFTPVSIYNENVHAAEMYKKCLSFAYNDNPLYNNFQGVPSKINENYSEIKMIQKKNSKRFSRFGNLNVEKKTQQVVFSTLTRIYLKKNINLLFPIQDFLFECNKHVNKSTGSRSREYLEILLCVKKLKMFYGYIPLKQLHRILSQASIMPGYFSKNFFSLIEKRLDVALYRSGFAKTIVAARQACRHSKIYVNSKICRFPSTLLNPGDVISYTPKKSPYTLYNKTQFSTENDKIQKPNFFLFDEKTQIHFDCAQHRLNDSLALLVSFCGKCVSNSIILDNKNNKQSLQIKQSNKKCIVLDSNFNPNISNVKTFGIPRFTAIDNSHYIDNTGFFSSNQSKINKKDNSLDYFSFMETMKSTSKSNLKFGTSLETKNNTYFSKQTKKNFLFPNNFHLFNLENLIFLSNQIESYCVVLALRLKKKLLILKTINNFNTKTIKNRKKQIDTILYANTSKIETDLAKINKPIHLEISKITNSIIFLYSPQRIYLPFHLDIDILRKGMKK
uniref:SSU ribosomal protein S4p n=1 Tax=Auxenochlorella protothecoides TaxID=3075 RepID=A0A1Z1GBI9_AUXPR|nr:SSU ribosomal protein S4p [Auxenochlorella protothecoides]